MSELGDVIGSRTATIVADLAANASIRGGWTWSRYTLLDRGSYDYARDVDEPELAARAIAEASKVTERTLRLVESRALRLGPGDYLLAHHDRVYERFPIEVTIDLSPSPVEGAEIHYRRRGAVFFRVPSAPGSAAIVERGPTVTCNHTYISKRHLAACVVRLVLLLAD
jgi:hypothetical protein